MPSQPARSSVMRLLELSSGAATASPNADHCATSSTQLEYGNCSNSVVMAFACSVCATGRRRSGTRNASTRALAARRSPLAARTTQYCSQPGVNSCPERLFDERPDHDVRDAHANSSSNTSYDCCSLRVKRIITATMRQRSSPHSDSRHSRLFTPASHRPRNVSLHYPRKFRR
mgnify:CR=1 FL=1